MGEKIKVLLVQKHRMASELAEYLGVSKSYVSKWLNGDLPIHWKYHPLIASFFEITTS